MAKYMQWCGQKYIGGPDAPIGFGKNDKGTYTTDPVHGIVYELRKHKGGILRGHPYTGWYLYGGGHKGTLCARRILDAVDKANELILNPRVKTRNKKQKEKS